MRMRRQATGPIASLIQLCYKAKNLHEKDEVDFDAAISQVDEERCNRIIKYLAASDVFQTPTLTIHTVGSKRFFADSKWRDTYQFLPRKVQES